MSKKKVNKNIGDRIQLYLNQFLTDEGLLWINKRVQNNKLNHSLIELINHAAAEEFQGLGNRNVTTANNISNNDIVNLLVSLVQNGQINTNGAPQPQISRVSNEHVTAKEIINEDKETIHNDNSNEETISYDNENKEIINNDNIISVPAIEKLDSNSGADLEGYEKDILKSDDENLNVSEVSKEVGKDSNEQITQLDTTKSEVAATIEYVEEKSSFVESNSINLQTLHQNENVSKGPRIRRRRSINNYNGQMTNGIDEE